MAKKSRTDEVVEMLRARGLRRQVAQQIADAANGTKKRTPKQVLNVLGDLRKIADDFEDRITGGPAKRKAAAQKAAATRKRAASKRSASAKKGAQTRAKAAAKSPTTRARSTAKRSTTRAKTTAKRTTSRAKAAAKR
jgi:hypothetical protein